MNNDDLQERHAEMHAKELFDDFMRSIARRVGDKPDCFPPELIQGALLSTLHYLCSVCAPSDDDPEADNLRTVRERVLHCAASLIRHVNGPEFTEPGAKEVRDLQDEFRDLIQEELGRKPRTLRAVAVVIGGKDRTVH